MLAENSRHEYATALALCCHVGPGERGLAVDTLCAHGGSDLRPVVTDSICRPSVPERTAAGLPRGGCAAIARLCCSAMREDPYSIRFLELLRVQYKSREGQRIDFHPKKVGPTPCKMQLKLHLSKCGLIYVL